MTNQKIPKSPWQEEFESLPEWAKKMVRSLAGYGGYGGGSSEILAGFTEPEKFSVFHVILLRETEREFFDGFLAMRDLAAALTAPWPPPPPPEREKRSFNLVEAIQDEDDDCAFDQPCCFGHRVNGHAIYCHNESWPDHPGKCWRNRTDFLHEDCAGFVRNPDVEDQRS